MPSASPHFKPLRVLHIVPAPFSSEGIIGGAERYALELAKNMAAVVPTTLVTFGQKAHEKTDGQLRVRVLGNPWYARGDKNSPVSPKLWGEILKADVVHCHQRCLLTSSLAAVAGRLTGRRVFVSDLGGGGWDISYHVPTDRWYRAHLHISEYSQKVSGHADKPWAKVILGGVDVEKFSPDATVPKDNVVRFVGRVLPHKGIDDLVKAVPLTMPLEIIGRLYHPQFAAHLQELAQGKQVTFQQDCDDASLVQAYRKALCVVLPSVYKDMYGAETLVPELLGQTLLEGMACGIPAICTDVASMPEIVEEGVTGFVVPPNDPMALGDKLRWLHNNPAEAAHMGQAARQQVLECFTWPQVVKRCLQFYMD